MANLSLYSQNDFLLTLAYLMGEKTVNSSTSTSRGSFIQDALHDAYGAFPWPFARARTTLTLASNLATLPADFDPRHNSRAFIPGGDTAHDPGTRLDAVSDFDDYQVQDGDRAMWLELPTGGDGTRYILRTKDSDVTSLAFRYQTVEPTLDSANTIKTPYPNKRTIALGARAYVKGGQDPNADISQELTTFDKAIANDLAQFQVQEPRKRRRNAQGQTGSHTGDF